MSNLDFAPVPANQPHPTAAVAAVRLRDVVKEYQSGDQAIRAIDNISIEIPTGQFVAIVGRSGSGKSTLLNLLAGIDTPSSGEIWIGDTELGIMTDDELTMQRRDRIGMVYQFFNLLSTLSVRENVALPALLAGNQEQGALARADSLLDEVGMSGRRDARPHTLSGGEMQRTALARALIHHPKLILADEPTGNLDSRTSEQIVGLLSDLGKTHGATVVLVTHSPAAAGHAERVVELLDGHILHDELKQS
ncbi:MAG: ABC transporter ATP-binding protein [Gemmatimonadota bacterium]|nr:ABC transporter ATP-binding protein [Gemmatimonadota bacterium]